MNYDRLPKPEQTSGPELFERGPAKNPIGKYCKQENRPKKERYQGTAQWTDPKKIMYTWFFLSSAQWVKGPKENILEGAQITPKGKVILEKKGIA